MPPAALPALAPGVFISFSRKSATALSAARELRDLLDPGLRPFLDERDVEADEPWRVQIVEAISRCRAAVVFLAPEILGDPAAGPGAPWVLQEATLLRYKKDRLREDFALRFVLLDGLQPEQIAGAPAWAPLWLAELQLATTVADFAAELVGAAAAKASGDPDDERAQAIAEVLEACPTAVLERLSDRLQIPSPAWVFEARWARVLARACGEALVALPESPAEVARMLYETLPPHLSTPQMVELVHLCAPNLWVDAAAARTLRDVMRGASPRPALAAAFGDQRTARQYACRAAGRPRVFVGVLDVNAGEDAREATAADIEQALKRKAIRPSRAEPFVAGLPRGAVQKAVLDGVRASYPAGTFLVYEQGMTAPGAQTLGAEWLPPPLEPARETDLCEDLDIAVDLVRSQDP